MRPDLRLKHFARSDSGAIAVIWALSLVVVFGFAALIFDIGRAGTTQSELQTFVDHVALAAANELDGKPDAITRATAAANNLINDSQTFARTEGTRDRTLGDVNVDMTLRFLATLPALDTTPIAAANVTTNPAQANYIEVTAAPRSVGMIFFGVTQALLGQGDGTTPDAVLSATAVAGAGTEFCDIPPVFFCKPAGRSMTDISELGTMVLLRTGGGNAGWGPGNFGWLDPTSYVDPGGPCAGKGGLSQVVGCMVGAERTIASCVSSRGVDLSPGQSVGIYDAAFNVRFDRFDGTLNSEAGQPNYTAAPNIVAGFSPIPQGSKCKNQNSGYQPSTVTVPLPIDASLNTSNRFSAKGSDFTTKYAAPVTFEGQQVSGVSPMDLYLAKNHPNTTTTTIVTDTRLNASYDASSPSGAFLDQQKALYFKETNKTAPTTRFEIYLREIAYAKARADKRIIHSNLGPAGAITSVLETGTAQCNAVKSDDPFRRVIIAAEIDCSTVNMNGSVKNIRPNGFVTLFLTHPVGASGTTKNGTFDMWAEVLGDAKVGIGGGAGEAGGKIRDVVRLFR